MCFVYIDLHNIWKTLVTLWKYKVLLINKICILEDVRSRVVNIISEIKGIIMLYLFGESYWNICHKIIKTMLFFCWTTLNVYHYPSLTNSFLEVVEIYVTQNLLRIETCYPKHAIILYILYIFINIFYLLKSVLRKWLVSWGYCDQRSHYQQWVCLLLS